MRNKTNRYFEKWREKLMVTFFPGKFNLKICSKDGLWNSYFKEAENAIDRQWEEIIWPNIKDFSFESVLELAPGAGRNTKKLAEVSDVIHAADLNKYALDQVKERFKGYSGPCQLHFYQNNGNDLQMIESDAITLVYCWDSAVHFNKLVLKKYIKEFSRVLKVNGKGFVHHSNLGKKANKDINKNIGWRTNMSKALFRRYCNDVGLKIIDQIDLPWGKITDCISIFQK